MPVNKNSKGTQQHNEVKGSEMKNQTTKQRTKCESSLRRGKKDD